MGNPSLLLPALVGASSLAVATVLFAITLWRRIRRLEQRLEDQAEAASTENLLLASHLLEASELLEAELRLAREGAGPARLQEEDRELALRVCARYSLLGGLLRRGLLSEGEAFWRWGERAVRAYRRVAPLVLDRQRQDPRFAADFQWLCARSRRLLAERSEASSSRTRAVSGPQRIA